MLEIYKHQKHSKCPRCLTDNETTSHVLRCPEASAQTTWQTEMDNLHTWIIEKKGSEEMAQAIIEYLNSWHHDSAISDIQVYSSRLQDALQQQNQIGWQSFLEGYWSIKWREYQTHHLVSIQSQRSSVLWISQLQRRIWKVAWTLWEHRNTILHSEGKTIHQYEADLINQRDIT